MAGHPARTGITMRVHNRPSRQLAAGPTSMAAAETTARLPVAEPFCGDARAMDEGRRSTAVPFKHLQHD